MDEQREEQRDEQWAKQWAKQRAKQCDKQCDIVIVGGGLSGLALAAELASPEFSGLSVLVLEKRSSYLRDRTWSYWHPNEGARHRYSDLERASWGQWAVSLNERTCLHASQRQTYSTLDADAFYTAAKDAISSSKNVELCIATSVASIEMQAASKSMVVRTEQGSAVQARWVFDARPPQYVAEKTLVQQFVGWEIHTTYDAFDKATVQLMSFEPHAQGLHFWYILPYSSRSALVESTWISPAHWHPDYEQEFQHYLAKRLKIKDYSVAYKEHGVLPLGKAKAESASSRVIPLGRGGGTLRPSTGYAFLDTLSHAKALADSLRASLKDGDVDAARTYWQPHAFKRPAAELWMDAVFLNALAQDWLRAPDYFMQMFARADADDIVAFLTGQASVAQRIAIMRALPVAPFAKAALRQLAA
jgi:lycopene beta-cyclase